jgi:hypothetical protein
MKQYLQALREREEAAQEVIVELEERFKVIEEENIMKFQTQNKVGDENVGGNTKETNKLPKGLQEKAKTND